MFIMYVIFITLNNNKDNYINIYNYMYVNYKL